MKNSNRNPLPVLQSQSDEGFEVIQASPLLLVRAMTRCSLPNYLSSFAIYKLNCCFLPCNSIFSFNSLLLFYRLHNSNTLWCDPSNIEWDSFDSQLISKILYDLPLGKGLSNKGKNHTLHDILRNACFNWVLGTIMFSKG